ncbi:LuxR C-terminal-related transcriptional regulator [Paenibacillus cymbidii]|uniref:LuxR C-terminal-related transcriptional regulator n=1 Tax=Paenibacillus cymbidii TaxID=1639034 RepID=UPI001080471D|nr:LuxR C-terminal-related transcriptional regulator [Paenibacillus cymbidii]
MNITILATKLYIPVPRTGVVLRPRLIDRLNRGLNRKLTLISASAGFGKTTLVSEWAARCDRPVAWLSLDEGDLDPTRFLTHFIAALRKVEDSLGGGALGALQLRQPLSTESVLTMLLNEISALTYSFVLVLDDYHVMDAPWIDNAFNFLLEHLPPQMHLVIATRENPSLSLGRLRAMGHLTEIRDADLRFTPDEAAAFLDQVMGLRLTAEEIAVLETRTEGWIAGLQLAALSMQGRNDIKAFIQAFAGDNRYIMDYLVEEVLQRQPDPIRNFLLQTSILDRLFGPLCDAVTGQENGAAQLQFLERGNFFVVPLDDRRHWYRYHHLFAEVLSAHLKSDRPDQVAILHQRASKWFEQHGSADDAIRHSLAAKDYERTASLVELAIPALRRSRQESAMLKWLKALPDELVRCRPVLSVWYAGALLAGGKLDAVEVQLRNAERWLQTTVDQDERPQGRPTKMVVVDEEEFRRLPGLIAVYRAGLALVLRDVPAATRYARQAIDLVSEDDHLPRGAATALLGLALWRNGELEEARRVFADGITSVQLAGAISDAINGSIALAEIRIAQGRLRDAMHIYERGLQLARDQGEPDLRGTADIYVGMSELCREHDDLEAAKRHLSISEEQGEHTGFPQYRYGWRVSMARIREAEGNLEEAFHFLCEAESLYVDDFFLNVRPVAALKALVQVKRGRVVEALDWASEQRLSAADELSYAREFEHIVLARVMLAQYNRDRSDQSLVGAIGLLERLLQAAEEGGRMGSAIAILIVHAVARQMQGDIPAALMQLKRALKLAEPEGYVRLFVDEGRPMESLLKVAAIEGIAPNYVQRLLKAFRKEEGSPPLAKSTNHESLSERERDVLGLLITDLSGPEIARELSVSLNTLRTHTKNIYEKLKVNNRRAAVRRAKELDLLK